MRKDTAKAISTKPKPGHGGKAGEGGIIPLKTGGGSDAKQPKPPQSVELDPANKVPSLLAFDRRNLHTPYAKSTFNIVDAM